MAERVALLIGTRKGAFVAEADPARDRCGQAAEAGIWFWLAGSLSKTSLVVIEVAPGRGLGHHSKVRPWHEDQNHCDD